MAVWRKADSREYMDLSNESTNSVFFKAADFQVQDFFFAVDKRFFKSTEYETAA